MYTVIIARCAGIGCLPKQAAEEFIAELSVYTDEPGKKSNGL